MGEAATFYRLARPAQADALAAAIETSRDADAAADRLESLARRAQRGGAGRHRDSEALAGDGAAPDGDDATAEAARLAGLE